jgi:hypothetical protein
VSSVRAYRIASSRRFSKPSSVYKITVAFSDRTNQIIKNYATHHHHHQLPVVI